MAIRRGVGVLAILGAVAMAMLAAASLGATAHRSGCHSHHTCPSDHHTYIWYDANGRGWDCAEPGAPEVGANDTTRITYEGLVYLCHAAGVGTTRSGGTSAGRRAAACGTERWTVKTLQDRPTLLPTQATTIAHLVSLPAPTDLPDTRLPFERHVFRVTARVTLVRHEADSDFHVVLEDAAGNHMIAESPLPSCAPNATPLRRSQMATVRAAVRVCADAVITGVAFFDFRHGQTGVAPNAIELHPILTFVCAG